MMPPVSQPPQPQGPEQELEMLKAQSQMLAEQLSEMKQCIQELEKKEK